MGTVEQVRDEAMLRAVARYAECGDAGAQSYLRRTEPFGRWGRRTEDNRALADETAPPEEFMEELSEALAQLEPAERAALREALGRSP
jgi:hypothetical protein